MGRKTPLYQTHVEQGAKIVDFGGWDMPLHYGSQLDEHHAVRRGAGMFDVSHMCVIDLRGARVREFLRYLLANDVAKLQQRGKALYSCLLNDAGGVLDDLIVYFLDEEFFRLVVNAGTRDKDLAWIRARGQSYDIQVDERDDLAMLAIQGPQARAKGAAMLAAQCQRDALALPVFFGADCGDWFIARTGYTGEDGFEIMLPAARAVELWNALRADGVATAGLGARDTLRLEAGMNLYGNDMDESQDPLQSGLAWTVAFEPPARDFIGRDALEKIRRQPMRRLVGLLLEERGVLRNHQRVIGADGEGEITSGGFSPTLNRSIALARIPPPRAAAAPQADDAAPIVQVDIRGKLLAARIVKPPFVRNGRSQISL
jgi:aminomethyltransferase